MCGRRWGGSLDPAELDDRQLVQPSLDVDRGVGDREPVGRADLGHPDDSVDEELTVDPGDGVHLYRVVLHRPADLRLNVHDDRAAEDEQRGVLIGHDDNPRPGLVKEGEGAASTTYKSKTSTSGV